MRDAIRGASVFVLMSLGGSSFAEPIKPVAPAPGRDTVKPMKPDWCGSVAAESGDDRRAERAVENLMGMDGSMPSTMEYAKVACQWPNSPVVQAGIAAFRQADINENGLSEATQRKHLAVILADDRDAVGKWCQDAKNFPRPGEDKRAWDYGLALKQILCGTSGDNWKPKIVVSIPENQFKLFYYLERPDQPTNEMARALFVNSCIPGPRYVGSTVMATERKMNERLAGEAYMACAYDVARLDEAKALAKLDELKPPPLVRQRAELLLSWTKTKAAWAKGFHEAWANANPKTKDFVKTHVEDVAAEWQKSYETNKAALDAGYAVEETALSRVPGAESKVACDKLHKAWQSYIAAKKPKSRPDFWAVASGDPIGYELTTHLALCKALDGRNVEAAALAQLATFSHSAFRGPRVKYLSDAIAFAGKNTDVAGMSHAPFSRIMKDYTDVVLKTANDLVDTNTNGRIPDIYEAPNVEKIDGALLRRWGQVATATKAKGYTHLTFKTVKWEVPDYKCTEVGAPRGYLQSGQPIYEKNCKLLGVHTEQFTMDPIDVVDFGLTGLKPGVMVKTTRAIPKKGTVKVESIVFEQAQLLPKGAQRTISYFGIPLSK
jgi:hypothetical protein